MIVSYCVFMTSPQSVVTKPEITSGDLCARARSSTRRASALPVSLASSRDRDNIAHTMSRESSEKIYRLMFM